MPFVFVTSASPILLFLPSFCTVPSNMSDDKFDHVDKVVHDHEVLGDKVTMTRDEVMHFGALTPEELEIEKKLRRKIDMRIMPMVVLVYLMNYIDRYA